MKPNMRHVLNNVKKPDAVFDFGPGVLNSEAWEFQKAWGCKIIGIEACPQRYSNLLKNNYPGTLINKAVNEFSGEDSGFVGGKFGQFKFGLEKESDPKHNDHEKVTVQCTTVDDLDEEYGPFNKIFIWADIEGAELKMMRGAKKCLSEKKIAGFNLELWPRNAQNIWPNYTGSRCTADEVIEYLKSYEYEITRTADYPNFDVNDDPTYESKKWFADYLFLPKGIK
jgi:FkbM family methyltransferase